MHKNDIFDVTTTNKQINQSIKNSKKIFIRNFINENKINLQYTFAKSSILFKNTFKIIYRKLYVKLILKRFYLKMIYKKLYIKVIYKKLCVKVIYKRFYVKIIYKRFRIKRSNWRLNKNFEIWDSNYWLSHIQFTPSCVNNA